jgi:hypothetical protein
MHYQKLGPERISYASQFTIPDTAGTTPDPAGQNSNMRYIKPNQAGRTSDFIHPLVSSNIVPIFIPHLSFSPTTLPSPKNIKLIHLSLSLHAIIMS